MLETDSDTTFTFVYERPKSVKGIDYVIEWGFSLTDWSTQGIEVEKIAETADTETWGATIPVDGEARFVRLQVVSQE